MTRRHAWPSNLHVVGRLIAPAFSIGNAYADPKTIPPERRARYIDRKNTAIPFNHLRYLADYERAMPGAFAVRDEQVRFEPLGGGLFRTRIAGNRYPGVHRVSISVSGSIQRAGHDPQPLMRSSGIEVALGILPTRVDRRRPCTGPQRIASWSFEPAT